MNISIFGLGYVGSVTAACLSEIGHQVVGVDILPQKVINLQNGIPPVKEPQLEELLKKNITAGNLSFSMNVAEAIKNSECAIIAVGTPSDEAGNVNLIAVERCIESIAGVLKLNNRKEFSIVIRSTVPPGTTIRMEKLAKSTLAETCRLTFCMNPEFLREGVAVKDFFEPSLIVFGSDAREAKEKFENIYEGIAAQTEWLDTKTAELVKYTNNAFHALKVAFANEIGRIAAAYETDGKAVMELLCADNKLNISAKYLRPGFAFGGSCLPKDLRGLKSVATNKAVNTPLVEAVIASNDEHINSVLNEVKAKNFKKVAILGIVFKTGTDDVRESASLRLVQLLLNTGIEVMMYDANLKKENLMGTNRQYIEAIVPNWSKYYTESIDDFFQFSDLIVVPNEEVLYKKWLTSYTNNDKVIMKLY
ncbi:MAG: nucleotide sugar dehydrogenase [Bacteroidota bacterium]